MNANQDCIIRKLTSLDVYGQSVLGAPKKERCAVVKLRKELQHTTVRADSSQSRGHGDEFVATNKILLDSKTAGVLGDQLTVNGYQVRIMSADPRFDASGKLDHYEVTGELWA